MAAQRKNFTVNTDGRVLNVRKFPAMNAPILRTIPDGTKIAVDSSADVPAGWKSLLGESGFVMAEFLK